MFDELKELIARYGEHSDGEAMSIDIWQVGANVDFWDGRQAKSARLAPNQALVMYTINGEERAAVITREEYQQAIAGG